MLLLFHCWKLRIWHRNVKSYGEILLESGIWLYRLSFAHISRLDMRYGIHITQNTNFRYERYVMAFDFDCVSGHFVWMSSQIIFTWAAFVIFHKIKNEVESNRSNGRNIYKKMKDARDNGRFLTIFSTMCQMSSTTIRMKPNEASLINSIVLVGWISIEKQICDLWEWYREKLRVNRPLLIFNRLHR